METNRAPTSFKVLIFPWLAHGHIFPYFELAKRLAKKKFRIFFCSTAINLSYIKKSFNENSSSFESSDDDDFPMEFIEIHLPDDIPNLPPHHHTTKGLPKNMVSTLIRALGMSKTGFSDIINRLKPDLLIYDSYQPWAVECANSLQQHKIPSVHFYTSSAASISYLHHISKYGCCSQGKPLISYPFPEIYLTDREMKEQRLCQTMLADSDIDDPEGVNIRSVLHSLLTSFKESNEIALIKSCGEIEGKFLGYLSSLSGKKIVSLSPLVHEPVHKEEDDFRIINWLNAKNPSSVVFVSFGSETCPSEEMMGELAHGLEQSGVNFIWAVRFPGDANQHKKISQVFPEGFLERTKDRGMIVEGWAPQTKILRHPSTGGFVSHCGWGSVTEAVYYGVPLIGMPLYYDQPINCRLVVGLGVGKEVVKNENGEWRREEIGKVIKDTVRSGGGDDNFVKRKARELSQTLRMEEDELMDEAIEELRRICFQNIMQPPLPTPNP